MRAPGRCCQCSGSLGHAVVVVVVVPATAALTECHIYTCETCKVRWVDFNELIVLALEMLSFYRYTKLF